MKRIKHVLMIVSDDLRPELNCFGKQKLKTPNLDRLAGQGIRYDRAYCNYPQCMPSRTSVMKGVRPPDWVDRVSQLARAEDPTLPAHLRRHGMKTMTVGKVYHTPFDDEESWSLYDRTLIRQQSNGAYGYGGSDYQLPENREKDRIKATIHYTEMAMMADQLPPLFECVDAPEEGYIDHRVATRAVDWIQKHAGSEQGLFLSVGFTRPHLPWTAPKKYWDLYDRSEIDLADNPFFPMDGVGKSDQVDLRHYSDAEVLDKFSDIGRYRDEDFPVLSKNKQRELIHAYWASVSLMDAQVGRLLDALEEAGIADETAIVFWGDNGYHLGEHKLWTKVTHFDESTRVPLILKVPGRSRDETVSEIVELVDIYPTICALLDFPVPPHLDGSVLPMDAVEKGKGYAWICMSNGHTKMESSTIVTNRYRYTKYIGFDPKMMIPGRGNVELFDHECDRAENINVANNPRYIDIIEDLNRRMAAISPSPHGNA